MEGLGDEPKIIVQDIYRYYKGLFDRVKENRSID